MKLRVQIQNETYDVEVGDLSARPILVTVDGEIFEVYPEGSQNTGASPALLPKKQIEAPVPASKAPSHATDCAPPASQDSSAGKDVAAPIPGVIISIAVKPGDQVVHGQELCVLEAMKMKNAIRSTRAGTIEAIQVSKGDSVSHGQVLMFFKG